MSSFGRGQGLILALAVSSPALAQTLALAPPVGEAAPAPAPVELPEVVVPLPDEPEAAEAPGRRDPTAATTILDVSGGAKGLEDSADVVAKAPGVHLLDSGGLGQRKSVTMRGASSNGVLVFLDGVPLNGAGGIVDLSMLPLAIVDRFEISRGGAGARYGAGGLGGVIHAVTRAPTSGTTATAELRVGSFDTATAQLSFSGEVPGGRALLIVHGLRTDGDFRFAFDAAPADPASALEERVRSNNAAQQGGGIAKYAATFGGWELQLLLEGTANRRGLAGTSRNPTLDATEEALRGSTALRLTRRLDWGELSARAYHKQEVSSLAGGFYVSPHRQRYHSTGAVVDLSAPLGGTHLLTLGAEGGYDAARTSDVAPAWARGGLMAMDEWLLWDGRLSLVPSVRLDALTTLTQAEPTRHLLFSPKLGASLELPWQLRLRANAGQAHRWPSMMELFLPQGTLMANAALRPERALTFDVGLQRAGEHLDATVTGFYSLYEDLISYEYYPPLLARPFNFHAADVKGAELELVARLGWAELDGSYTLTFSQNLRDDPRYYLQELPYRPRHKARARLSVGPDWLRGRLDADYRSEQFMNRTQTVLLPARVFLHAGATVRVLRAPVLDATLELRNLLDTQSEDLDGYPLPGRSVFFTLSFTHLGTR